MSMLEEESLQIDWEAKFKSMKKKLAELKSLRSTSVRADAENLRKKIDEHRKIHEISVSELKEQNLQLESSIRSLRNAQNEIDRLESTVSRLQKEISLKDSTLGVIMRYPMIKVMKIDKGAYELTCGKGDVFSFRLVKDKSYHYYPISLPSGIGVPDFAKQAIEFEISGLSDFCSAISSSARDMNL